MRVVVLALTSYDQQTVICSSYREDEQSKEGVPDLAPDKVICMVA